MNRRLFPALSLLSASIIACQLTLMQMLAQIQWSHFAYMVISVALLGFGASGTLLSLKGKWFLQRFEKVVPILMLLTALSLNGVILLSAKLFITFDAYLLFIERSHISLLLATYFVYFIPFFLGALSIGLIYIRHTEKIGPLYFADLAGSGIGALIMPGLFWLFLPTQLLPLIALLPLAAGMLLIPKDQLPHYLLPAFLILALSGYMVIDPAKLKMSEYKDLSGALNLPETQLVKESPSPYGLLQQVESNTIRYAPGLSLTFRGTIPQQDALFNNGNWFGPLVKSTNDSLGLLNYTTSALPYRIAKPSKILILNAGTGMFVRQALQNGVPQIVSVEPNKMAIRILREKVKQNSPFDESSVKLVEKYSRSFLLSDSSHYDLIILPNSETFGGTSGIDALDEQYLFTLESFGEMMERLTPDGMIAATTWMDYPVRSPLKLMATVIETHEKRGIGPVGPYLAVIRGWGTITMTLKKSPLTGKETEQIRFFCQTMNFDPVLLPDIRPEERTAFNQLQDENFFRYVDQLLSPDRNVLYQTYAFNIRPATDQRPYFSQFLKLKHARNLGSQFGNGAVPFLEIGYWVLLLTALQIVVTAIILIIIPLLVVRWRGPLKTYTVFHFGGIGIGYMFVEIVWIQQFTLYFGNTVYAASAVLCGMLLFSGIGSLCSSVLKISNRMISGAVSLIMAFILICLFALSILLKATITLPFPLKFLFSLIIIAPAAFFMGMPFPLGLRFLKKENPALLPWAWGINGCLSVISTALATFIAVEAGSDKVMLIAALSYGLCLLSNLLFGKDKPSNPITSD